MTTTDAREVARADVWRGVERVGSITRTRTGSTFEYDDAFLRRRPPGEAGIALRLPYARQRFETAGVNLHPFFAGLLPEGLRLRAVVRLVKTSADDLLSLLVATGADTIGDVAVVPEGVIPADSTPEADIDRLEQVVFADLFAQSLAGLAPPERSWAVAGVQSKVSAARVSFPVRSRRGQVPSLLKLGATDLPRLAENEAFFLAVARDCGLSTPDFRLVRDARGEAGLLVARFDRIPTTPPLAAGRIHQEDACQFLDRFPADKYRVSLGEIGEALAEVCSAPILAAAWLVRLQTFAYAIGNGDLHARNVSVRRGQPSGRVEPTPAYDLVSTLPYGDDRMALKMEGRDRNLRRADFLAFGRRLGVREAAAKAILDEVRAGVGPRIPELDRIGLDARRTRHMAKVIGQRLAALG